MTLSLFGLIRERCGLSIREAAAFHRVSEDTVKSWSAGRKRAPDGVIAELRRLYEKIEIAADNMIEHIERMGDALGDDGEIEIGIVSDDHEAQSLGWPCVGAQAASIGIAAASIDRRILIVPRGSTSATAAAADRHEIGLPVKVR